MNITVTLNGVETRLSGAALDRLVDHLPQKGLTGARQSCGVGRCGACMVPLPKGWAHAPTRSSHGWRPVARCNVATARRA